MYAAAVSASNATAPRQVPRPMNTFVTTLRPARTVTRSGPVKQPTTSVARALPCTARRPTAAEATAMNVSVLLVAA